ncbi:MAG TPA: antibiotic biosynthesis monooxygenase family protein [Ktedonobacterales bacterium]|nr:antibiotic biosynthesis monooxygenase family protein [Ktedonobacterales bacterium]
MYGTVARLKVKAGAEEALMAQFREYSALRIPGYQRTYVYRMDNDPAELYMAVVFDSKESYRANAESPEQDQRYRAMLALLDSAPEWHDGEIMTD